VRRLQLQSCGKWQAGDRNWYFASAWPTKHRTWRIQGPRTDPSLSRPLLCGHGATVEQSTWTKLGCAESIGRALRKSPDGNTILNIEKVTSGLLSHPCYSAKLLLLCLIPLFAPYTPPAPQQPVRIILLLNAPEPLVVGTKKGILPIWLKCVGLASESASFLEVSSSIHTSLKYAPESGSSSRKARVLLYVMSI
jgi:hypothetical protein